MREESEFESFIEYVLYRDRLEMLANLGRVTFQENLLAGRYLMIPKRCIEREKLDVVHTKRLIETLEPRIRRVEGKNIYCVDLNLLEE